MRAMILAAGRGQRMNKMTEFLPKPLLHVHGHYLIEYSIHMLKRAGIREIVINVSYRGDQIKQALGNGERYGVKFFYSEEQERLETGGGILKALPLLGNEPFIVISCDIITDYPIENLLLNDKSLVHLVMVKNPTYHLEGDFGLENNKIIMHSDATYTFGSMGLYHPELFTHCEPGHFRLTDVLNPAILAGKVTGELYQGVWYNIGTPEDLNEANLRARENPNFHPLLAENHSLLN